MDCLTLRSVQSVSLTMAWSNSSRIFCSDSPETPDTSSGAETFSMGRATSYTHTHTHTHTQTHTDTHTHIRYTHIRYTHIRYTHTHQWKWRDIRPRMVTHTRNLCSAFNPSKVHTHSSEHTHTPWTHTRSSHLCCGARGAVGDSVLAQGHLSRGIEGEESAVHSLPPPTIPARPETRTHNLSITSPTL